MAKGQVFLVLFWVASQWQIQDVPDGYASSKSIILAIFFYRKLHGIEKNRAEDGVCIPIPLGSINENSLFSCVQ